MLTVGQTSFILFEVPSNLLLKQFSPHVWQSRIFFMWGIITACQAASQNRHQLYAMRFLLGMFEAGMFPGVMAQLSSWYRTDEMGKPVTWLYTLVNLSGIVGALRCYDYPKSPRSGRFLSEREQEFVEARLPENAPVTSDPNFSGKEIVATLRGPLIWAFLVSQATINVGCYALIWYLPTIITSMGFTGLPRTSC
ncbi:hypothetical protein NW754_003921 [Fusarium falciforme]|nr:hypothetical protein NW754_003921 [Fusarium falciforme]